MSAWSEEREQVVLAKLDEVVTVRFSVGYEILKATIWGGQVLNRRVLGPLVERSRRVRGLGSVIVFAVGLLRTATFFVSLPVVLLFGLELAARALVHEFYRLIQVVQSIDSGTLSASLSQWRYVLGEEHTSHLEEQTAWIEGVVEQAAKAGASEKDQDWVYRSRMRRVIWRVCWDRIWDLVTKLGAVLGIVGFFRGA